MTAEAFLLSILVGYFVGPALVEAVLQLLRWLVSIPVAAAFGVAHLCGWRPKEPKSDIDFTIDGYSLTAGKIRIEETWRHEYPTWSGETMALPPPPRRFTVFLTYSTDEAENADRNTSAQLLYGDRRDHWFIARRNGEQLLAVRGILSGWNLHVDRHSTTNFSFIELKEAAE